MGRVASFTLVSVITALLSLVIVPAARAFSIGIPDGTYSVEIDWTDGTIYDATGMMEISNGTVVGFHATIPTVNIDFDCGANQCTPFASTPDSVRYNFPNATTFVIRDEPTSAELDILSTGAGSAAYFYDTYNAFRLAGTWVVTNRIPEPQSWLLIVFGLIALGVGRLVRLKARRV